MPAVSKPLGYNCPKCGLDYGSEILFQKNVQRAGDYNKKQKSRELELPKRSTVSPVEYALLKQKIIRYEEDYLGNLVEMAAKRPRLNNLDSDPETEKQMLMNLIRGLRGRMEARDKEKKIQEVRDAKWDTTQKVDEIEDPRIYRIMKLLQRENPDTIIEEIKDSEGKNKTTIRWNPIKQIKKYRQLGDLFRHLHIPIDYLPKMAMLYPNDKRLAEYILGEKAPLLKKACQMMDRYREQFCNKNWSYKWIERFWIVAYAETEGIGKTRSMLQELDGKEGKISRKHLKKQKEIVLKFWEEFFEYIPYLFDYAGIISHIINYDPDLNRKYDNDVLAGIDRANEEYMKKTKDELFQAMLQQYYYGDNNTVYDDTVNRLLNNCGFRNDNKKIINDPGLDCMKIIHSNPNYKKEMKEYEKQMEEYKATIIHEEPKKPMKKTQCTISTWSLPPMKLVKLLRQHKFLL